MRGFRRSTSLARFAAPLGALLVGCLPIVGHPGALMAQSSEVGQETTALHWGTRFVWFRATDKGTVEVYASAGYRSAFAQPVTISADDAERWAGLVEQLSAAGSAGTPAVTHDTTVVLGEGAVIIESSIAASGPRMRAQIGANRGDVVIATLFADGAPMAAVTLHSQAQVARHLHSMQRRRPQRQRSRQRQHPTPPRQQLTAPPATTPH